MPIAIFLNYLNDKLITFRLIKMNSRKHVRSRTRNGNSFYRVQHMIDTFIAQEISIVSGMEQLGVIRTDSNVDSERDLMTIAAHTRVIPQYA